MYFSVHPLCIAPKEFGFNVESVPLKLVNDPVQLNSVQTPALSFVQRREPSKISVAILLRIFQPLQLRKVAIENCRHHQEGFVGKSDPLTILSFDPAS